MKDELERAYRERKEVIEQHKKHEQNIEITRNLLMERLDLIFSDFSVKMQTQSRWLIDTLLSTGAIMSLGDLRDECNLVYAQEKEIHVQKDLSIATSTHIAPAKLEVSISQTSNNYKSKWQKKRSVVDGLPYALSKAITDYSMIYCSNIEVSSSTNLHLALSDYKNWQSYYYWKDTIKNWAIADESSKIIKDFDTAVNFLEIPPLEYIYAQLTWNYKYHTGGEIGDEWEEYERILVSITKNNVEVGRKKGTKVSTAVTNCTSNWVKQQIANVYVNYGSV